MPADTNKIVQAKQPADLATTDVPDDVVARADWFDEPEKTPPQGGATPPPLPPIGTVLREYWLTIALIGVLVFGVAVPAIWLLTEPQYRAGTIIEVSPLLPKFGERESLVPVYQTFFNGQLGRIGGPDVLNAVLDRKDVLATGWYKKPAKVLWGEPPTPFERLKAALEVSGRGQQSALIDVRIMVSNPKDAMVLANAVANEYIDLIDRLSEPGNDAVSRVLTKQVQDLGIDIDQKERELAQKQLEIEHTDPALRLVGQSAECDALRSELAQIKRDIASLDTQLTAMNPVGPTSQPTATSDAAAGYSSDPDWIILGRALKSAERFLALEEERLGAMHPELKKPRSDVEFQKELLLGREEQLRARSQAVPVAAHAGAAVPLDDSPARLLGFRERARLLENQIREKEEKIKKIGKYVEEFARIERELHKKRQQHDRFSANLEERELQQKVPGSIRILGAATAPSTPERDRRLLLSGMALAGALAAGLGVSYLRCMADKTMHEDGSLARMSRGPFLGHLPRVSDPQKPGGHLASVQTECVRMVRTALLERLERGRGSAVLISSAGPRAGKTTVSSLLSRSLAEAGLRVLLVDTDRRRAGVSDFFAISPAPGLGPVLSGTIDERDAVQPGPVSGLSILPAGAHYVQADAELFSQQIFATCLQRWRERYDVVVLDSPPLLPVADARILSRYVDGTILVVRASHCRRAEVVEALSVLSVSGGRLIGTVMTGARRAETYLSAYGRYYQPSAPDAPSAE